MWYLITAIISSAVGAFIDWALGNGYDDNLTLERVNVNGNYEPSNCTWIPMKDQYKNKQTSPQYKAVSV